MVIRFGLFFNMKVCSRCNQTKSYNEFHKRALDPDGYRAACKMCRKFETHQYYLKNKDKIIKDTRAYNSANPEKRMQIWRSWAKNNPEKVKQSKRRWKRDNKNKVNANTAKRRANRINRTPSWANLKEIKVFYENCPKNHHVDHIVPLCGSIVSGLHVLNNLQYLPATENLSKGNKFTF